MKRWNVVLAVVAVVVLAVSGPLAMASDNCMAMGAMCEGPCGTSSCAVAQLRSEIAVDQTAIAHALVTEHVPTAPLTVRKLPPKSPASPA